MYYVYILQLKDNTYYHGFSEDLRSRIKAHESGIVESTKNLRPISLIYYSSFKSKKKALEFERYLKTQSGYAFRNKRLIDKQLLSWIYSRIRFQLKSLMSTLRSLLNSKELRVASHT